MRRVFLVFVASLVLCWPVSAYGGDEVQASLGVAVEGMPDVDGDSWGRARYSLMVHAPLPGNLTLDADGDLRQAALDSSLALEFDEADLHRLLLTYRVGPVLLSAGRFTQLSSVGLVRVDGAAVEVEMGSALVWSLWGGRLGHVEPMDLPGDLGFGVEMRYRPRSVGVLSAYELRRSIMDLRHRFRLAGSLQTMGGISLLTMGELGISSLLDGGSDTENVGYRLEIATWIPATQFIRLNARVRWLGLTPSAAPWSSLSVVETLAPQDYGVSEVGVALRLGPAGTVLLSGGPTLYQRSIGFSDQGEEQNEWALGGTGRFSWTWRGLAVHGLGTAVGGAWYLGGALGARRSIGPLDLLAEGGLYRHQGLDRAQAWIGDVRLQAAVDAPGQPGRLQVALRVAGGSDRVLSPWIRAGVAIHGRVGATP